MYRRRLRRGRAAWRIGGLVAAALTVATPGEARALELGVVPATRKVRAGDPVPVGDSIRFCAARNEWEGFQIVVRDDAGLTGVDVTLSDLCDASGEHCVPAATAKRYREHFLDIEEGSPFGVLYHEREPGRYPDPLIPFTDPYADGDVPVGAPFDVAPGDNAVVYIDWYVPPDTLPGEYNGTATVLADGQTPVEVPVRLVVWDFAIPTERTIGTAFGFGADAVRRYHGGPAGDPAAGYDEIVDRYYNALHEHRIDPTTVNGPVEFTFDASGVLEPVDWTAYDAAVAPFVEGTRFPDGVPVARFNVARFRPGSGLGSFTEDEYQQAARAFAEHLQERGWWDRAYIYASDEPWLNDAEASYARIAEDASRLNAASPLWVRKTLVTSPWEETIADYVGIWTPVTPMYDDWWWYWEDYAGYDVYAAHRAAGGELWFYVCNANTPPYAGFDIDTMIGYEPRIVMWGTFQEGASGFLYWRVSYWVDNDPWNVWWNLEAFPRAAARQGDGLLIYPGDHDGTAAPKGSPDGLALDGPIVSYRLKQIRDGLEDWELLRLAVEAGAEDFVHAQVARAYRIFGTFPIEDCNTDSMYCPDDQPWTLDENVLLDAREQIARKLQYLRDPTRWSDPETSGDATDHGDGHGCGCAASGGPLPLLPALMVLLGLAWWRRRLGRRRRDRRG